MASYLAGRNQCVSLISRGAMGAWASKCLGWHPGFSEASRSFATGFSSSGFIPCPCRSKQ